MGHGSLPRRIAEAVNGEIGDAVGNGGNTASHVFAVHFDFAGVAVADETACGNIDVGSLGDGEEGFAGGGDRGEVVGKKLNGDSHGKELVNGLQI
jgi:hypothetical protein